MFGSNFHNETVDEHSRLLFVLDPLCQPHWCQASLWRLSIIDLLPQCRSPSFDTWTQRAKFTKLCLPIRYAILIFCSKRFSRRKRFLNSKEPIRNWRIWSVITVFNFCYIEFNSTSSCGRYNCRFYCFHVQNSLYCVIIFCLINRFIIILWRRINRSESPDCFFPTGPGMTPTKSTLWPRAACSSRLNAFMQSVWIRFGEPLFHWASVVIFQAICNNTRKVI